MIEVTRLYCPASGAQPGQDNSTHHLIGVTDRSGQRMQRVQVCATCERTAADLRAEAEQAHPEHCWCNGTGYRTDLSAPCLMGEHVPATPPETEETPVDVADRIVHDAKTRDLLRGAYALTHKIHVARQAPITRARERGEYLPDLMASREVLSAEIRRRARPVGMARARGLFIALDGHDEPTVWQDRRTQDPEPLVRRSDVPEIVWDLLAQVIDTRSADA